MPLLSLSPSLKLSFEPEKLEKERERDSERERGGEGTHKKDLNYLIYLAMQYQVSNRLQFYNTVVVVFKHI